MPERKEERSLGELFAGLASDTSTLVRQEVALAKTELKENASRMAGHATHIAIGGFVAYAGIIVLLIGIGHLLGAVLLRAGMDPTLAQWLAPSLVGLVVAIIGWVMLSKAKSAIAHDELAPRQTIDSLRDNKQWAQSKLHHSS